MPSTWKKNAHLTNPIHMESISKYLRLWISVIKMNVKMREGLKKLIQSLEFNSTKL